MTQQLPLVLDSPPPRQPRASALRHHHIHGGHELVEEAKAGEEKAARQEEAILASFEAFRGTCERMTPSQVNDLFPAWPITSVRRALSNLTRAGRLVHYRGDRRPGPRGARESVWGLA